jgi:hypothetical protein
MEGAERKWIYEGLNIDADCDSSKANRVGSADYRLPVEDIKPAYALGLVVLGSEEIFGKPVMMSVRVARHAMADLHGSLLSTL